MVGRSYFKMFKLFKDIDKIIKEKKIKVVYTKGYKNWSKRFNEEYKKTHNVKESLDKIHGELPKSKEIS